MNPENLYEVTVTTTWEFEEKFMVAAKDGDEARKLAKSGSHPDIWDADVVDTMCDAHKLDPVAVYELGEEAWMDTSLINSQGQSENFNFHEFVLGVLESQGKSIGQILLERKEKNNGQISMPL